MLLHDTVQPSHGKRAGFSAARAGSTRLAPLQDQMMLTRKLFAQPSVRFATDSNIPTLMKDGKRAPVSTLRCAQPSLGTARNSGPPILVSYY